MSEEILEKLLDLAAPKLEPATKLQHCLNNLINEDTRTIYLGDIEEHTGEWVTIILDHFNSLSSDPINIKLNSPGGDVLSMFVIHDMIRASKAPVHVVATGWVASAAVLILACGHKRSVTESCCLMSHAGSVGSGEMDRRAVKDRRQWEDWQQKHWCDLMARYTLKPCPKTGNPMDAKWWNKITETKAEWWRLGAQQIVESGLADEVV